MRVVFIGPPGSGKGTQAQLLCARNELVYLGTGDMLRAAIVSKTPLGLRAREFVESGRLVPDDLVNELIAERLNQADQPERFILDGYPRTLVQAKALDSVLEGKKLGLTAAVVFRVPDEEIVRRLSGRGRNDDGAAMVQSRLEIFHRETAAIAAYYRTKHILREVSGMGEIEQVYTTITRLLRS